MAGEPLVVDQDGVVRQNARGHEVPDPTPLEIPAGFKRPETLQEQIKRLIRGSLSEYAEMHGHETFEEAEDFEVDDDFDPSSPFEVFFDPVIGKEITLEEFQKNQDRYAKEVRVKTENFWRVRELEERIAGRGAGVSPAPSSSEPQAPPAEPQAAPKAQ